MLINALFGELAIGQHFYHGPSLDSEHYFKSFRSGATNRYGTVSIVPETTLVRVDPDTFNEAPVTTPIYKALLVQDGAFRRLFVFDPSGKLVSGILNYDNPRFYCAVPAARFVLKLGMRAMKCHEELCDEADAEKANRNDYIAGCLQTLWLMLPEDAVIDETHHFRFDGGAA